MHHVLQWVVLNTASACEEALPLWAAQAAHFTTTVGPNLTLFVCILIIGSFSFRVVCVCHATVAFTIIRSIENLS